MEKHISSWLNESRELLELLESKLPSRIDHASVSLTAKIPFKVLWFRGSLIWRFTELCRSAFEDFKNDKLVSAILLTRAALETGAALWYLSTKIKTASESGALGDIDDYIARLILGSKTDPAVPQAINVLSFVDKVDKDIPGFRKQYDVLSEYAHPNWEGTTQLYSKPDPINKRVDFGSNMRGAEYAKQCCIINLNGALLIFENTYDEIAVFMSSFIKLCESQLRSRNNTAS